jgi:hypothetical protein
MRAASHGRRARARETADPIARVVLAERGGDPLVHERPADPWPEIANQLNETVIRRVIRHDLRIGDRGRQCH